MTRVEIPQPTPMDADPSACDTCGESYHDWEFDVDRFGNLVLFHLCDPLAIERYRQILPRYEQIVRFGLMACGRCEKVIQRRRMDQKWCTACGMIVRREQDAARWRRKSA